VTYLAAGTAADDGRGTPPLRWLALELAATAIFNSYYQADAIGPIADLSGRQRLRWYCCGGGKAARTVMGLSLRASKGAPTADSRQDLRMRS
jgi:hypothetical protein